MTVMTVEPTVGPAVAVIVTVPGRLP
jgi:hypothetical protein